MTEPILNQSRVTALIRQSEPAAVPQLVKVDGKLKPCDLTQLSHGHIRPPWRQREPQPGEKQPGRLTHLSLESPEQSQLVTLDRV